MVFLMKKTIEERFYFEANPFAYGAFCCRDREHPTKKSVAGISITHDRVKGYVGRYPVFSESYYSCSDDAFYEAQQRILAILQKAV